MKINVVRSVLEAGEASAAENRRRLDAAGVVAINVLSAPGSGKTALLERTIPALGSDIRCAVLVGDRQPPRAAASSARGVGRVGDARLSLGRRAQIGRSRRASAGPQRPLPLRQRQEIHALLRPEAERDGVTPHP